MKNTKARKKIKQASVSFVMGNLKPKNNKKGFEQQLKKFFLWNIQNIALGTFKSGVVSNKCSTERNLVTTNQNQEEAHSVGTNIRYPTDGKNN